jgi:RNA polymerase primary sigma factor
MRSRSVGPMGLSSSELIPAPEPQTRWPDVEEGAAWLHDHAELVSPRHYSILKLRAAGQTLEEIGQSMRITRERVRQLEAKAVKRLKDEYDSENSTDTKCPPRDGFSDRVQNAA